MKFLGPGLIPVFSIPIAPPNLIPLDRSYQTRHVPLVRATINLACHYCSVASYSCQTILRIRRYGASERPLGERTSRAEEFRKADNERAQQLKEEELSSLKRVKQNNLKDAPIHKVVFEVGGYTGDNDVGAV